MINMESEGMNLESFGMKDFSNLTVNQINSVVKQIVEELDLGSGSCNTFELFLLLQTYLKNKDKRLKINKILNSVEMEESRQSNFNEKQKSINYFIGILNNYTSELKTQFLSENMDDNLVPQSILEEYLIKLHHIQEMMVNDLK